MIETKSNPLIEAAHQLRDVLDATPAGGAVAWAESVHAALGRMAAMVQVDVRNAEHVKQELGDANPDIQHAPTMDRHFEATRALLIRLGEMVHQLRTDLRQVSDNRRTDVTSLQARGREIVAAIEKVRKDDEKFMLDAMNSNPGAGE